MNNTDRYLEIDFIIWNSNLGIRDFVKIGEIDRKNNTAYLDEPYEMVGPLCLNKLFSKGEITFAACVVMTEEKWEESKKQFYKKTLENQQKSNKEFYENINKYNKRKRYSNEKEYRELLSLPLEGLLKESEIKRAFRKLAKTTHPDVGGSKELFLKITQARDALIS